MPGYAGHFFDNEKTNKNISASNNDIPNAIHMAKLA